MNINNYPDVSYFNLNEYDKTIVEKYINPILEDNPKIKFKQCKKCDVAYPLHTTFYKVDKKQLDGFATTCHLCKVGSFDEFEIKENIKKNRKEYAKNKIYLNDMNIDNYSNTVLLYEKYLKTNKLPYNSFISENYPLIIKYLIDDKLKLSDHDVYKITRGWIQKYKLYGVQINIYNGVTHEMIIDVFPDRYVPWKFTTVGSLYWKDENNIKYALNWLVEQLYKDNIINKLEDIPYKVNGSTFKNYDLYGLLCSYFNTHSYYAFEFLYPNMFYPWEFNPVPDRYYESKENRINMLRQLIEDRLNLNYEDIPKVLSFEWFYFEHKYYKFKAVLNEYYSLNLYSWIDEVYPNNNFQYAYKNVYECLDGTIVNSEPERIIQHIFLKNNIDFTYNKRQYKFTNGRTKYYPDWIIQYNNKIIIVEYYGMLNMNNDSFCDLVGYDIKYMMKDKYYKELCIKDDKYIYLALYKDDLKNNKQGLIDKLNNIGINIIV